MNNTNGAGGFGSSSSFFSSVAGFSSAFSSFFSSGFASSTFGSSCYKKPVKPISDN